MLCHGDYMDWYCGSPDGFVSEFIGDAMAGRGWRYTILNAPIISSGGIADEQVTNIINVRRWRIS